MTPGAARWPSGFAEDPAHTLVACDFDGTLAAIVDDPEAARPLPGVVPTLNALAATDARVAVISGRPVSFLAEHLAGARVGLYGLYGMEWIDPGGTVRTRDEVVPWRAVADAVARAARSQAPPDVEVEHKGLAVTLHWRRARARPDAVAWVEEFARGQSELTGVAVQRGRLSVELRPPLPIDKGSVVEDLADGQRAACFLGDDVGDLPAFAALDRLAAERGLVVVKVAVVSDESRPELLSAADVLVDGPEGALALLQELVVRPPDAVSGRVRGP